MRHQSNQRKFGRKTNQRKALMKTLAVSLVLHGRIKTTEAKAKSLRPFVEKLVTLARKQTLAARRLVIARVGGEKTSEKLMSDWAVKYAKRDGGYTRITKLPARLGDGSPMAMIEFVD